MREGRFQKHLAAVTVLGTFFSGFEALYSHYKNNFRYGPMDARSFMYTAADGRSGKMRSVSPEAARTWLPVHVCSGDGGRWRSAFFITCAACCAGPGDVRLTLYNIIYGPPLFAPLLFAACGSVGLLASLMRRERQMNSMEIN